MCILSQFNPQKSKMKLDSRKKFVGETVSAYFIASPKINSENRLHIWLIKNEEIIKCPVNE